MKNLKSIIVLTAISLVVALALSVVNMFTAPIIEESANAAANGAYLVVLPDATNFSDVEGEFPPSVLEMKKDEGGTGFAFKLTATSSYSQSPMEMILGINNEGKITKLVITNYAETKGSAAEFEAFFEGKDAAVTDVIAGVTYTTNAIKTAIKEAYDAFYQFADIEKSDEQKLMDLYATVLPGGTDKTGAYSLTDVEIPEGAPEGITSIKAPNTGVGYIVTALVGDKTVAMGINAYGAVSAIYDLDGNDLSADAAYDTLKTDVAKAIPSIYETNHDAIVAKMVEKGVISSASAAKKVDFSAVASRVVAVYELADGLAYVAHAEGYGGVMEVCYVINADGNIVKYATLEQHEVDEAEYGMYFGTVIKNEDYAARFDGQTTGTVSDDTFLIAGSTFTTNATKACWADVKAAAEIMNKEAAQ